jgi:outer membrane protein assembly factor BamD
MRNLLVIVGFLAFVGCSNNINKILRSSDYEMKSKKASELYDQGKYSQAQLIFEDVMPVIRGQKEYEGLYYKWAYSHYYQKDYLNAENLFKTFVESFPASDKAAEAEYMRAYCFFKRSPKPELDQSSTIKAIGLMQTFVSTHPNHPKIAEARDLMEKMVRKLEVKELKSAELYYHMGYYKASATAYTELLNNYPDSEKGDQYKIMVIRSWFKYAENSYPEKQAERFERVLNECADFGDRFPDSKLEPEMAKIQKQTENILKSKRNEQAKATTQR